MLYIGTSTQFQFSIINRDALDQATANNRIDVTMVNVPVLPKRKDEAGMGTVAGNVEDRQLAANNDY
jgi:hypothetical protein